MQAEMQGRRNAGLTQEQPVARSGSKKSYILRRRDVRLSALFKIFQGLGKRGSVIII